MTPYDNYEISPCTRTEEPNKPGLFFFEVCDPAEADVWTLYGHLPEGGVEAIGDFCSREAAEATFQRITGVPFGTHDEVVARLRVMHAGQRLLEALQGLTATARTFRGVPKEEQQWTAIDDEAIAEAFAAIAKAEGRAA